MLPSLFDSLKHPPSFCSDLSIQCSLSLSLCLSVLWIVYFLSSGSSWKIGQCLCQYLVLGALYHRAWLWLTYHSEYLHFGFILWVFSVFLCGWVCSNASRISNFRHLHLNSPDTLLKTFSLRHTCFHVGRFVGWRKLLSITEVFMLDFGYFCHWISSKRTNNYLGTLWKFGYSWPVPVDTKINPVSHSALVEIFFCRLWTEKDLMSILHDWMDCISQKGFRKMSKWSLNFQISSINLCITCVRYIVYAKNIVVTRVIVWIRHGVCLQGNVQYNEEDWSIKIALICCVTSMIEACTWSCQCAPRFHLLFCVELAWNMSEFCLRITLDPLDLKTKDFFIWPNINHFDR